MEKWRTLIRVDKWGRNSSGLFYAYIVIPAWSTKYRLVLVGHKIPNLIQAQLAQGHTHFYANCNLGTESSKEVKASLSGWESLGRG